MGSKRALSATKTRKGVTRHETYRLGELFSGAGGTALAAHKANYKDNRFSHVWVNDNNKDACETLKRNIPIAPENVRCCDIQDLDMGSLPDIDGLVFGFPCNDFSIVGDRDGISGNYGGLYRWGIHCLEVKQPLFFVAENVSGLVSSNNDLDVILEAMKSTGYRVFPKIYRFEEYGVPQARHRIIIVGFRSDLSIDHFVHPRPTTKNNPKTCREALAGIKPATPNNELTRQSDRVVERLKHIRPGENAFTASLPKHLKLVLNSNATISQIYRRLKPDAPSYTVTGSGGGGTHLYHWKEHRALTNRERARLQTFPDGYVFWGGKESVRKQIGMAVPPRGAKPIFRAVLKTLHDNEVPCQC